MTDYDLPESVWWPLAFETGESLLGLAARTMDENLLPHLLSVLQDAGQTYRNRTVDVMRGDAASAAIAAKLNVPVNDVDRRRGGLDENGQFIYHGVAMRPKDLYTRVRRFSPGALALKPVHRSSWMIRHLPICPETWEPLIHQCACAAVQDWTMVRDVARCDQCRELLADTPVEKVPEDQQRPLAIYAGLLSDDEQVRASALSLLPEDIAAFGPGAAVDMILAIAPIVEPRLHRSVRHPGTWRDRPLLLASAIARVVGGMLDGSAAMIEVLIGCKPAAAEPRTRQLSRLSSFLLGRGRLTLSAGCVAVLEHAAASMASPGPGDMYAIDFADAEKLLGRRRQTLRSARRTGTLRTAFFIRRGEILPALDRAEVERIASMPAMGVATFGRRLHLPPYAVKQMADASVLGWIQHPFVLNTQGIRIPRGEDHRLIGRLADGSHDLSASETVSLSTLLRSIGGRAKPYGPVFRALLDGDLSFELCAGAMLTTRVRIRVEDMAALRIEALDRPSYVTFPAPTEYNQMDACDILNLHVRNRDAVLALEHSQRNGGLVFDAATIEDLARDRVTSGELAALTGMAGMTVAARLRRMNLFSIDAFGWDRSSASHTALLGADEALEMC